MWLLSTRFQIFLGINSVDANFVQSPVNQVSAYLLYYVKFPLNNQVTHILFVATINTTENFHCSKAMNKEQCWEGKQSIYKE